MEDKEKRQGPNGASANSLAMELLQEVKIQTKRWMVAFFVVVCLWAATIAGFIWYLNQYDFVSYEQDGSGYNNINNRIGGSVYNGSADENEGKENGVKGSSY